MAERVTFVKDFDWYPAAHNERYCKAFKKGVTELVPNECAEAAREAEAIEDGADSKSRKASQKAGPDAAKGASGSKEGAS